MDTNRYIIKQENLKAIVEFVNIISALYPKYEEIKTIIIIASIMKKYTNLTLIMSTAIVNTKADPTGRQSTSLA